MADCVIENLHLGMNLRDPAPAVAKGETGLSLGCDFSIPGQVTPMNSGLLTWTLDSDITDAKAVYLGSTRYLFTTHADGLRVTVGGVSTLIDAEFIGYFKALPLNDEYVVLSNSLINRKWKPGWSATYRWGINTPSAPTVSAGSSSTKTIDTFESLASWSFTGGGAAGNLQADAVNYKQGTQSMQLTATTLTTIVATRTISLDLSKFVDDGDLGEVPYLALSYYTADLAAIQSIVIKLSCEAGGGFTKDYYKLAITLGGYVYATLSPTGEAGSGTYDSVQQGEEIYGVGGYFTYTPKVYTQPTDPTTPPLYAQQPDGSFRLLGEDEIPTETKTITIQAKRRDIATAGGTWTDLKIPLDKFARIGDTAGRDWSTISAIRIEVEASSADADISFDDWKMVGGGNLFGHYWAAVAYQNDQGNYGPFTDFAGPVELDAQSLLVEGLTPDTDSQTTKRRLVILGGSLTQPMVTYLEDNTSESLEFNDTEASLNTVELYFNNRKPPTGITDMADIGGRIFLVCGTNTLLYSEPLMYEAFPLKNYRTLMGGEQLYQVGLFSDGYVVARGKGREYITQITATSPAFWQTILGAKQGAVTSRLLLEDPAGPQVFMSERGFYASGAGVRGEYLDKINPVISSHSLSFGDMVPDRAYVWFRDTGGVGRVLRIDYRLGRPIAHYVANLTPAAIFADNIANQVFYVLGMEIYEFDAGNAKLSATLTIPGQLCGTSKLKTFESLNYELEGDSLTMALTLDRVAQSGSYTLAAATREETPTALPEMVGMHLGLTLTSAAGDDFTIHLPWIIDQVAVQ